MFKTAKNEFRLLQKFDKSEHQDSKSHFYNEFQIEFASQKQASNQELNIIVAQMTLSVQTCRASRSESAAWFELYRKTIEV